MGVIVPHVETRAEAERIVDSCRFPPRGHRSVAGPNPANRYQPMPPRELLDFFDGQTVLAAMLETPEAIGRADEIASVPGLDMVMVGPHDLTAEMGIVGQFDDERFLDALRAVAKACRAHDTIFGIAGIRDLELLTELVALGLRFVSAGTDAGFMTEAASAQAARLRAITVADAP
jgi:2-keto-3-deoxy-L-rhamnonate aldolase RhmA